MTLDPNPILSTKPYARGVLICTIEQQQKKNKNARLTDAPELPNKETIMIHNWIDMDAPTQNARNEKARQIRLCRDYLSGAKEQGLSEKSITVRKWRMLPRGVAGRTDLGYKRVATTHLEAQA